MPHLQNSVDSPPSYAVAFEGDRRRDDATRPSCATPASGNGHLERLLSGDPYSAAIAFVQGKFDISGDLIAAVRELRNRMHPSLSRKLWTALSRLVPVRLETYIQTRKRAAGNIRFHYDQSNAFYSKFLDSQLVYSAALFKEPAWTLEQAQLAKLDSICRKLDLRPGESFLDIGCGWGALMIHAAAHYRALASGCTLSRNQYEFATAALRARGLENHARVMNVDYRSLAGRFQKIASIGMFEHVGRHRLGSYFHKIYQLLGADGLFLNSGITRPQPVGDDAETEFLRREVFPGGELAHLSNIMRDAENQGFEVLEVESIRLHYARTCRAWVSRLQANAKPCIDLVGEATYRTWLLYLAASVVNFEDGQTDAYQILMAKQSTGS